MSLIADFTKKIYQDKAKDPREENDVHMARCYIEAFIRAMSKEGKTIVIIDGTTGEGKVLDTSFKD